jgi:hypothetical protein
VFSRINFNTIPFKPITANTIGFQYIKPQNSQHGHYGCGWLYDQYGPRRT